MSLKWATFKDQKRSLFKLLSIYIDIRSLRWQMSDLPVQVHAERLTSVSFARETV